MSLSRLFFFGSLLLLIYATPICYSSLDIVLVIDSSSVVIPHWLHVQEFLRSSFQTFTVSPDGVHMSVIQFSSFAQLEVSLTGNLSLLSSSVGNIKPLTGLPKIDDGIRVAQIELQANSRFVYGNTKNQVIIIVTGTGEEVFTYNEITNELKDNNVQIFVVVVGPGEDQTSLRELSSSDSHYFHTNTHEGLPRLVPAIAEPLCNPLRMLSTQTVQNVLIVNNNEAVVFNTKEEAELYTDIELRDNGEVQFKTGHSIHYNSILIADSGSISGSDTITVDSFDWRGGSISGAIVEVYSTLSMESQSDKTIRQGASVIAHSEVHWTGSGFMNGFDDSSLVVSPTGQLIITTDVNFGCRTGPSGAIDHPCVCDAELVIDGGVSFQYPHMNSRLCWGIQNNGVINHNSSNLWAFSYLSGNGDFFLTSDARILFASSTQDSLLGPSSRVITSGNIELLYDTTVVVAGFFSTTVHVTVQEGTLIFDDDSFLEVSFDLTVIIGSVIFNDVEQMVRLVNVRATQGSVIFNTGRQINITNLELDEHGLSGGSDHVYIENSLDWRGGGFGENSITVIMNEARASENTYLKYMQTKSHIINHGKFEFNGPTEIEGTDSYFTNKRDAQLSFSGGVSWVAGSASNFNYLYNYGLIEVSANSFVTQFIFEHHPSGVVDLSRGELMFAAGGFSLGAVHCNWGTRIGVVGGEFVFKSGTNSFIDGNSFFFLIRNPAGVIRVETLFSLETMYNPRLWYFLCFQIKHLSLKKLT
ncbi:hypothetical protein GEMRC1_007735 [Eukaryota sp. GEM-RC1]